MQAENAVGQSRRRPWVAVFLSFVFGGLGHVYCGRITRGLVFMFLSGGMAPIVASLLLMRLSGRSTMVILAAFVFLNLIWLYAVIDAYFLARKAGRDYQLKDYNRWYVYLIFVLMLLPVSIGTALLVREGFYEAFFIAAESMQPTLAKGDRVIADKRVYHAEPVQRGDVIVFINPNKRHARFIKRIVALPNDTVEINDNTVFINGKKLPATVEADVRWETNGSATYRTQLAPQDPSDAGAIVDVPETTIPQGCCYVLGDNRNRSRDSRHFGPIPLVDVVGRVDHAYFPRWREIE
ncbi:MAG: signal peptidase I [Planctomycetes bacterium]|nr:signal peptidase I [Planctomycetota bacterium]